MKQRVESIVFGLTLLAGFTSVLPPIPFPRVPADLIRQAAVERFHARVEELFDRPGAIAIASYSKILDTSCSHNYAQRLCLLMYW